jgi:hypothetical protein
MRPQLGPLPARIPLAAAVAERKDSLLDARALFVPASSACRLARTISFAPTSATNRSRNAIISGYS